MKKAQPSFTKHRSCATSTTTKKKFTLEPLKQILKRFNIHTKSFNLEHDKNYQNGTKLSKEYYNKTQPFHTKSHLENNNKMYTLEHNQKEMLSPSQ